MNSTIDAKGSCLCGSVQIEAKSLVTEVGACHCSTCRKWSGGPLLAIDCKSDVTFTGEEHISVFESSEWAQRGFCSNCGTHLFYRLKQNNQHIVPVGLIDKEIVEAKLKFDHQIFIDEKPEYYSFSNDTKNMTGAEVFAMFTGD